MNLKMPFPTGASINKPDQKLKRRVRQLSAKLAESESNLHYLVENLKDIPFIVDTNGVLQYVGPQVKIYGFDPNDLQGHIVFDIIFPDDREHVIETFNKSLLEGEAAPLLVFRIKATDGNIHWFEERSTLMHNASGKAKGFTGVLRDITERIRTEQKLRESEERYRKLFEAESDAILVFDAQTRAIVDVNPAAVELYGYTHEEFLKLTHLDITNESDIYETSIKQTVKGKSSGTIALRWHRKKDGSVFPAEISPSSFILNGRTVLCGIVRDITARIQTEKRQLRQEEQLRRLAARLATAQDEEQRRIAEGLHDDVAQKLALCSLKFILAERKKDPAEASAIRSEIDRLIKETLKEVRSLSFELSSSLLFKIGLKEALVDLSNSMSKRYGVKFTVEGDNKPININNTAAIVLFKAVRELLFNVVKHAGVKEASVSLNSDGEQLVLAVEDRGKGFQELLDHNNVNLGNGLGLFGIKERLRSLGGTLQIESTPGQRTLVALQVPLE